MESGIVTAGGRCSVIVPVYNKAALTRQCLDSIFAAPPSVEFEVIVVDDASSDSTPSMLASYGDRVQTVTLSANSGFATACNRGAAAATGRYLVFLNNDTIAQEDWLDALAKYADATPEASVVGSRLLYPDETIQHAGVVFTVSGDPLHIYAGFPAEHPAVMKPRRFQVVTAACLLVRAEAFDEVDGFDRSYQNDLEDVDLCLRLGERGHEVHYCPASLLYHLESASRAFRFHDGRSVKLYRRRWGPKVRGDELDYYLEDGLLELLRYSPELVTIDGGRREREAELLQIRSRQVLSLLRETIRIHAHSEQRSNGRARHRRLGARRRTPGSRDERRLADLRATLATALDGPEARRSAPAEQVSVTPSPRAEGYEGVVSEAVDLGEAVTPEGATVLVVSKGDEKLVGLRGRRGWHFPRAEDGRYRGYYPKSDEDALTHLDDLRDLGAEFLVFPETSLWWLDHYQAFASALADRYRLAADTGRCRVYDLRERAPSLAAVEGISPADYRGLVARVRRIVASVVPAGATVLAVSKGDDGLLDLPGRTGWHFPRAEDGRYRGDDPQSDEEAVADLERQARQGADFIFFPASAFWWLESYPGLRQLLERHSIAAWTEDCIVFDLRGRRVHEGASGLAESARNGDQTATPQLDAAEYARIVESVRELVRTSVPPGATVLVVSRGDALLVDLPDHEGWHFPRADDGRYRGYYPKDDEGAIAHLEELRSSGAEYLVFPTVALWWLDHYPAFAAHLHERYPSVAYDHETGIVFALGEPLEPSVVTSLIPESSRLVVSTKFSGDLAALSGYDAVQLSGASAEEAIDRLEELIRDGAEFLVIPRTAFAWHEENFGFGEYLGTHHRFVTRQEQACEIWELERVADLVTAAKPAPQEPMVPTFANGTAADGAAAEQASSGRGPGKTFRLWLRRRGNRA